MKNTLYIILLIFYSFGLYSQQTPKDENITDSTGSFKFCFNYCVNEKSLYSINNDMLSSHPLGENIARKLFLLEEIYTHIEQPTPTSPGEKTILFKPSIYNSLLKLNRHYKKQVKDNLMSEEEARVKLNQYLDIAISIFIENTESFEDELGKAKDPDEISKIFSMVMLK